MDRSVECKNMIALESSIMAMVEHSEAQVEEDSSGRNAGERMVEKADREHVKELAVLVILLFFLQRSYG
jgi:hypothetical protein